MASHDFKRRSFMQMMGVAGGTGLASSTAVGTDDDDAGDDEPSEYEGTVVQVLSMGGTIASTPGENGASPSESGEALIESVPELNDYLPAHKARIKLLLALEGTNSVTELRECFDSW